MNLKAKMIAAMGLAGLLVSAASADVIQYNSLLNGTSESTNMGGAGTGLYNATNLTTGEKWVTYCIDPIGHISGGNQWDATYLDGNDLANGEGILYSAEYTTDLANAADVTEQKYAMIGYLAETYYYSQAGSDGLGKYGRSELSLAFWEIARDYDGTQTSLNITAGNFSSTTSSGTVNATTLVQSAYAHRTDEITMAVWTPENRPGGHSQEFITIRVPEPSTISLLILGLGCMVGFRGFRRKK